MIFLLNFFSESFKENVYHYHILIKKASEDIHYATEIHFNTTSETSLFLVSHDPKVRMDADNSASP